MTPEHARFLDARQRVDTEVDEQRRVLVDELVRRVAHRLRALGCYDELVVLSGMSDAERAVLACGEAAAMRRESTGKSPRLFPYHYLAPLVHNESVSKRPAVVGPLSDDAHMTKDAA